MSANMNVAIRQNNPSENGLVTVRANAAESALTMSSVLNARNLFTLLVVLLAMVLKM